MSKYLVAEDVYLDCLDTSGCLAKHDGLDHLNVKKTIPMTPTKTFTRQIPGAPKKQRQNK